MNRGLPAFVWFKAFWTLQAFVWARDAVRLIHGIFEFIDWEIALVMPVRMALEEIHH